MNGLEWREAWWLVLLVLVPVVWWLMASRWGGVVRYSSVLLVAEQGVTRVGWRARLAWVPAALVGLGLGAMVVATAGPRTADATTQVKREGIAMVLAVDLSGSMQARDMVADDTSVSRLDAVKAILREFLLGSTAARQLGGPADGGDDGWGDGGSAGSGGSGGAGLMLGGRARGAGGAELRGRLDDAIGLVSFARYADTVAPLTLDHVNLARMLADLKIVTDRQEDGTAIGEGVGLAVERLRTHPAQSKVIVLLTDGVNNSGNLSPLEAAGLAADLGIRLYTVGVGRHGVAPVPVRDPLTGRQVLRQAEVDIDEKTLRAMAGRAGGQYFRATDAQSLAEIYQAIDSLERSEVTEDRYLTYQEHYPLPAGVGLSLLAAGVVLGGTVWRRVV